MPSYTRGVRRDKQSFVKVSRTTNLYYGFKTKDLTALQSVSLTDLVALGHLTVAALPSTRITIMGANSPKPPRVRKILTTTPTVSTQESASTYCGVDAISTALAAGWNLVNGGRGIKVTNNARTTTVAAKIEEGGYYLFPMNTADATAYAATLGLVLPGSLSASERANAFSGSTFPRPHKLSKNLTAGTITTFCSYDNVDDALAAGWEQLKGSNPHAAPSTTTPPPTTP